MSMLEEELEELLLELVLEDRVVRGWAQSLPMVWTLPCFLRVALVALLGSSLHLCSQCDAASFA